MRGRSEAGSGAWRLAIALALAALIAVAAVPALAGSQEPGPEPPEAAPTAPLQDGLAAPLQDGLLGPLDGLLGTLEGLLCPPVTLVAELVEDVPVVGDVGNLLRQLVCSLGLLEFHFYTVWEGPGGQQVERQHTAIIGVPTPLDVDDSPGPELIGTIGFDLSFEQLTLTVERASGQSAPLPVSVEAVISDPTGGLGKERIAFGYDQLEDRAPNLFEAQVQLDSAVGPGDPEFDLRVSQQAPGESTSLIGGFFDGSPQARENPTEARIDYEDSPTFTGLRLTLDDPLEAEITTNVTGPVVASLRDVDGDEHLNARATIEDLPSVFRLAVGLEDPRVLYTGEDADGDPQAIDRLNLEVDSSEPLFARADRLRVTIDGLPSGTELTVDGEAERVGLTSTATIGEIEAVAGSAPEAAGDLPPGNLQGARFFDRTGEPYVLGARIRDLDLLEAGLGEQIALRALTAGGPFDLAARLDELELDAAIRDLPTELELGFDLDAGQVSYSGSDQIDEIEVELRSTEPLLAGATELALLLQEIPQAFELGLGPDGDGLAFAADNPIGLIEATASSPGAADESGLLEPDDSGAVLRDVGEDFFLFARLFEMRELSVALDPIALVSRMEAGRMFTVDARLELDSDEENPVEDLLESLAGALTGGEILQADGVVHVVAVIDQLPAEVSLGLGDIPPPGAGTRLALNGSDPIDLLSLSVEGLELLEGADDVRVEINQIPTEVAVELPEEGPLATIAANDHIGQIRLAASDGSGELPERSFLPGDPTLNDLFGFRNVPGDFGIGVRLTAVGSLSVNLDPINLSLEQDAPSTRPIEINAAFEADENGDVVEIEGLLDRPSATTSVEVVLNPDEPTELLFENAANVNRLDLRATGLAAVPLVDARLDNLPRELSVCLDPGPGCQRPNPHSLQRYSPTLVSIDFDDSSTQLAGQFTTFNAEIELEDGDPVEITNLRFRNLGMDFGDQGNNASCAGVTVPRIHLFFDSRGHQFVMNSVKFPPTIQDFRIGTDGNPARATNRLVRLNGWNFACFGLNTSSAGGLACGGQSALVVSLPLLGNVNILSFLGLQLLPVCGGTVDPPS